MEVESECAQQLCGLLVVDHDDSHLDDEELILLVVDHDDGHLDDEELILLVVDHDDGHLDDEELILLVAAVEFAHARCPLFTLLEIPGRISLSSLNDAECKLNFRFTGRQICCVHEALQAPDRFRLPCRLVCNSMEGLYYYYYSTMALANKDDPTSNGVIYCHEVSVDLGALNRSRWRRE